MTAKRPLISALLGMGLMVCGSSWAQQAPMDAPAYGPGNPPPWAGAGYGPGYGPGYGYGYAPPPRPMMPQGYAPPGPAQQAGGTPCNHGPMGMHHGMKGNQGQGMNGAAPRTPGQFHENHMEMLRQSLEINEAQQAAWDQFRQAMDARHAEMQAFMESMREERQTSDNPYTMKAKMWDFRKGHQEAMMTERQKLLESLDEEQANRMETFFNSMGPNRRP